MNRIMNHMDLPEPEIKHDDEGVHLLYKPENSYFNERGRFSYNGEVARMCMYMDAKDIVAVHFTTKGLLIDYINPHQAQEDAIFAYADELMKPDVEAMQKRMEEYKKENP